jgi:hypothetical protein
MKEEPTWQCIVGAIKGWEFCSDCWTYDEVMKEDEDCRRFLDHPVIVAGTEFPTLRDAKEHWKQIPKPLEKPPIFRVMKRKVTSIGLVEGNKISVTCVSMKKGGGRGTCELTKLSIREESRYHFDYIRLHYELAGFPCQLLLQTVNRRDKRERE